MFLAAIVVKRNVKVNKHEERNKEGHQEGDKET